MVSRHHCWRCSASPWQRAGSCPHGSPHSPHSGVHVPKWGGQQPKPRCGHHFHQFPSSSAARHTGRPPWLVPPRHADRGPAALSPRSQPSPTGAMAAQPGTAPPSTRGCGTGPPQPTRCSSPHPQRRRARRRGRTQPQRRKAVPAVGTGCGAEPCRAVPSCASGATAQSRHCPGRRFASASSHHLQPPGAALQPPGPPRQQAPDTAAVPAGTALSPRCPRQGPQTGVLGVPG